MDSGNRGSSWDEVVSLLVLQLEFCAFGDALLSKVHHVIDGGNVGVVGLVALSVLVLAAAVVGSDVVITTTDEIVFVTGPQFS